MRSQGKRTLNAIKLAEAIAITTVMNWHRQTEQIDPGISMIYCRCIIRNKCENDTMFHNRDFGNISQFMKKIRCCYH